MEAPSGSPRGGVAERAGWYAKKYANNIARRCRLEV